MKEIYIIKHAKSYMDMLSKGINPITKEKYSSNSDINNERLLKCFEFVSTVLDKVIAEEENKESANESSTFETNSHNNSLDLNNTAQNPNINSQNNTISSDENNDIFPKNSLVSDEITGVEVINTLMSKGLIQQGIKKKKSEQ